MKILILSHLYPSPSQPVYGTFVHEQVKELVNQGCEVMVVSPVKAAPFPLNKISKKWRDLAVIPSRNKMDYISIFHPRYISFPKNILFDQSGYFMYHGIQKLVKNIKKRFDFDLIHAHVALPDGFAAMKLSKELNVPYVVTIHGQDLLKTINRNEKEKNAVAAAMKNAEKVILVSNRLNKIQKEHIQLDEKKVSVLHNGISDFFINKTSSKKKYYPENTIKILSVSRLVDFKGIENNIHAISELKEKYPNLHYHIAGDGAKKMYLQQLVHKLGLTNHITFLGAVPQAVVKELTEECDIFSLPSWNEAFGIVYLEAMAAGKPVIGCIGEGIEEIIEDSKEGFLVSPDDVSSLVTKLDILVNSEVLRKELGTNGRNTVLNKFTWKKNVSELKKIYMNVLETTKR